MLKKLTCPSYIQTVFNEANDNANVPVAVIPWDQFHTFMVEVSEVNRASESINEIIEDYCDRMADVLGTEDEDSVIREHIIQIENVVDGNDRFHDPNTCEDC